MAEINKYRETDEEREKRAMLTRAREISNARILFIFEIYTLTLF